MNLFFDHEWEYIGQFVGEFHTSSHISVGHVRSGIGVYNFHKGRVHCYEHRNWTFCGFEESSEKLTKGREKESVPFTRFVYRK